jgi:hypothetical protein
MLAAMRRASSRVGSLPVERPPRFILAIDKSECLPIVIANEEAGIGFSTVYGGGKRRAVIIVPTIIVARPDASAL